MSRNYQDSHLHSHSASTCHKTLDVSFLAANVCQSCHHCTLQGKPHINFVAISLWWSPLLSPQALRFQLVTGLDLFSLFFALSSALLFSASFSSALFLLSHILRLLILSSFLAYSPLFTLLLSFARISSCFCFCFSSIKAIASLLVRTRGQPHRFFELSVELDTSRTVKSRTEFPRSSWSWWSWPRQQLKEYM